MSRLLQIAQLGCLALRDTAQTIDNIADQALQSLRNDMLATMEDTKGVGIAAPQVYVSQRCFIFSSRPGPGRSDIPLIEPTFAVNPEIIWKSEAKVKAWESCLSIPGIRGLVPRCESIRVSYSTLDNPLVECELSGFLARVFQHEYDHLDGLMYLDRLESTRHLITEKEYQKIIS